jgi:Flp pilus assembly protein TadB
MDKINRFFIHFWLAFSIATLIWAFFKWYQTDWNQAKFNFMVPVIAFFWYLMRLMTYRRLKRNQNK